MIKTLARSIREYKKTAILTPLLVTVEVVLECIIPFIIAKLVNEMQAGCGMDVIVNYGIQLVIMAVLSLIFGVAAGNTCATASTGFARNLRKDMSFSYTHLDVYKRQGLHAPAAADTGGGRVQGRIRVLLGNCRLYTSKPSGTFCPFMASSRPPFTTLST